MSDLVIFTSNEVGVNCISSLTVAEMFGREPKNVKKGDRGFDRGRGVGRLIL
jgi:phage regulator Rha-like protein